MADICRLCQGGQFLFIMQERKAKWFSCPNCNGVGTIRCYAPVKIRRHPVKKIIDKVNKRLDMEEKNRVTYGELK